MSPRTSLEVHSGAEAKETNSSKDHDDDHQDQTELGLIDTMVSLRELEALSQKVSGLAKSSRCCDMS